jgi:hypothetical protein
MATVSHQPRVVILKFEDKNRYGRYGVACNILFGTNRKCVVDCEQHHQETSQLKRNQWALITLPESNELRNPKESLKGELVEIWGPVGDYAVELKAYQRHFGVLPCEYPSRENWMLDLPIFEPLNELSNTSSNDLTSLLSLRGLSEFDSFFKIHCIDKDNFKTLSFTSIFPSIEPEKLQALKKLSYDMRKHDALNDRVDIRHLKKYTFSIDNEDTKDVDDALSVEFNEDGSVRLGIHIADVASHIPCHSKLFQWAQMRAASVYFDEMKPSSPKSSLSAACNDDEENIDLYGSSCPMLPHSLAHDHLSLNQDVERNAISLWLHFDSTGNQTRAPYHQRTLIMNGCKTSYASFESTTDDYLSKARDFIEGLSGSNEAEVQVAWSMVTYNSYFAQVMVNLDKQGQSSNSVDEDKNDDDEEVPPLPPSSPPLKRSTSSESTLFSGSVNDVVGILSVQQEGKGEEGSPIAASYRALTKGMICKGDLVDFKHFGLDKPVYAHCSSPIRRFVDLFNQHAVYGTLHDGEYIENTFMKDEETLQQTMEELNSTYVNIKHFHATVTLFINNEISLIAILQLLACIIVFVF